MKKEEKQFWGKYFWGLNQSFYLDREGKHDPMWFRLWEELSTEEKERYIFYGEVALNYIRNSEGTEILLQQLAAVEKKFEQFRASVQKDWKESGGRQNPKALVDLIKGS